MMIKGKISNLNVGERFVYGEKNCIVLEHMDDGTLCMVLDEDFESKFGETNNFAESELRKKLNGEYLDEWVKDGASREFFMPMQVDLTANDGLKDYGTCECFLAPRTCDQHRKYRYLIPNPKGNWEWTATAYSTKANGYSLTAYQVTGAGGLSINYSVNNVYGVRPLFKLNSESLVECEIEVKADWDGENIPNAVNHLQKAVDTLAEIEKCGAETSIILGVIEILEKRRDDEIDN